MENKKTNKKRVGMPTTFTNINYKDRAKVLGRNQKLPKGNPPINK